MSAESRLDQVRQVSTHEYSHPSASIVAVRRIPTTTRNSRVLTHSLAIVRMRSFVKGYIVSRYSKAGKAGKTSTSPYCRSAMDVDSPEQVRNEWFISWFISEWRYSGTSARESSEAKPWLVAGELARAASSNILCVVTGEGFPKGCNTGVTGLRSIHKRLPYTDASSRLERAESGLGQCNPKKAIGSGLIVGF